MLRRVVAVEGLFNGHAMRDSYASKRHSGRRCVSENKKVGGGVSHHTDFDGNHTVKNVAGERAGPSHESFGRRLFTSWQQGVVASIGAVMGIGAIGFFFYAPVKDDTVHHTAVVASEALGDVRLREQAIQLSKEVVESVLKDPKSLDLVVALVVQLLRQDDTKIAVSSFLRSLFEDHYTQEVTKKFVLMTILDPWIQEQLRGIAKDLASGLLQDPEVKKALVDFLTDSAAESLRSENLICDTARTVRSVATHIINPWL
ncbi:hypothetical protein DQ04_00071040 [Trypanosoma grayi]|uniref:hypothetical protein n=1 Tax=Trypanosoma grayi TaxID=71804 RepID=UPI0004F4A2CF|nr:hypothetical protein DQ04_00071040 [Trypanosoma grayi]KEG15436.1 hypothetical protein DQ04_00071040 [Trypanosoma grayi]